jgi:hypothetical protein
MRGKQSSEENDTESGDPFAQEPESMGILSAMEPFDPFWNVFSLPNRQDCVIIQERNGQKRAPA